MNTFPCKHDGCTQTVVYKKKVVIGLTRLDDADQQSGGKVVYLTCDAGHTHSYVVD